MTSRMLLHAQQRVAGSLFKRKWDAQNKANNLHNLRGNTEAQHPCQIAALLSGLSGTDVWVSWMHLGRGICLTESVDLDRFRERIGRHVFHDQGFVCFATSASGASKASASTLDEPSDAFQSSRKAPKICILGGGFGGLYTAVKLDGLMWPKGFKPEVTLIDQSDRFVFKPLLYEILTGTAEEMEVAPFFRDLLEPFQTSFIQANVVGVAVSSDSNEGGVILLNDGEKIPYDWLVVAIGAKANFYGIPGVMENAVPFCSYQDVQKIASTLTELNETTERRPHAVVVGGGYAGVELAAALVTKIKRMRRQKGTEDSAGIAVTLITDTNVILPAAPISQRQAAEQELRKIGVDIKSGFFVTSIEGMKDEKRSKLISLTPSSTERSQEGSQMEADLVMWTAGSTPATSDSSTNQAFPFERTSFGSLRTEPTLMLRHQKRVFALGDDAFIEDPTKDRDASRLPATAQVAFQQADYVAWNLWASINKRPLLPFRYQHLGDMMSLGSQNAAIALPVALPKALNDAIRNSPLSSLTSFLGLELGDGDDARDQRLTVDGPIAALLRRLAYWYRQPTNEQKARIARQYFEKVAQVIASRSNTTKRDR